ncbi:MAG: hypothetical protein U0232_26535 [Thermomicrobiales bacterium]
MPRRLADELVFLDGAFAQQPTRADLAVRVANLRARLADRAGLLATVRAEVQERLAGLADRRRWQRRSGWR